MDIIDLSLVSIITPCFNGEKFIHIFLESILCQTYKNIELILINDGSTDQTEKIIFSYQESFLKKGIQLIYIYQENAGQAAALNQGLKIFKGNYLKWIDSDDFLTPLAIEEQVNFLVNNKQYDFCMCKTKFVLETNIQREIGFLQRKNTPKDNLFYDLILENNVVFCGPYLFRTSAFLKVNPSKKIYESHAGQNWQMNLPMAYHFRCGYINNVLFICVIRQNSHSRNQRNQIDYLNKTYQHEDVLTVVIKDMKISDEKMVLNIIQKKYAKKRIKYAFFNINVELVKSEYIKLKELKSLTISDTFYYIYSKNKRLIKLLIYIKDLKRRLKK